MIGFPCVATALLLAGRLHHGEWSVRAPLLVGAMGLVIGVVVWAVPRLGRPLYLAWYGVACGIGFVVGNALLAGVYYLVFTPIGCGLRLAGRRAITKRFDRAAETYWQDPKPSGDGARYYRQF